MMAFTTSCRVLDVYKRQPQVDHRRRDALRLQQLRGAQGPLHHDAHKSDDIDAQIDAFIQKLKDNGSDKVVEEAQKQLSEWRASVGKTVKK